jgi:phosphate transport system permease protein
MTPSAHIFRARPDAVHRWERSIFWVFRVATYFVLLCGAAVFLNIIAKGSRAVFTTQAPFINTTFLTEAPESLYIFQWEGRKCQMGDSEFRAFKEKNLAAADVPTESYVYSAGGIFPCIVGTVLLVVGAMTIALALGVCAAIYLNEYARDGRFIRFVRLAILNLAGVPSIVFGLFGFGLFVVFFGWNVSLLAGWFTLAFMVLPVVITASEESLKSVPKGFREGSLALGATKWQTIRKNVLPYALPGILTSSILGIARVAGETAPIMFTAAYVVRDKLPWDVASASDFFFQGVMALPYHIYVVSSKIPQNEYTERVQYGTAFVFLVIVAMIATASILLRNHLRNRYKW